jgi:hypothetical protein
MTASRVSAWLDGEIEAHACDAMCEQLGAPHTSNLEAAIDMCLIGHVLREQAQGVVHSGRSARVLAALQVSYENKAVLSTTPSSQDNLRAAPVALSQRAANDPWFNWRATGSAVAVALALVADAWRRHTHHQQPYGCSRTIGCSRNFSGGVFSQRRDEQRPAHRRFFSCPQTNRC